MRDSSQRIPSLDGARAISITLVILSHAIPTNQLPGLWRIDLGRIGVQTFFVISGFLITNLLLSEECRSGTINVPAFYVRRAFRIMPAYYTFLIVMALLVPMGWLQESYHDLVPAALYFGDYAFLGRTLGHTWSLAVEEQFYLLWPSALLLLGIRRSLYGCIALILIAPAIRIMELSALSHAWTAPVLRTFECVCDALAFGCALAIARERLWANPIYRACVNSKYLIGALILVMGLAAVAPESRVMVSITYSALGIAIAMVLDRYMRFPDADIGVLLNWPPVVWIGTISYSLYLWQHPFMFNTHAHEIPLLLKVAGAVACAAASYYLVERPMLALRARLRIGSGKRAAETPPAPIAPA